VLGLDGTVDGLAGERVPMVESAGRLAMRVAWEGILGLRQRAQTDPPRVESSPAATLG
jgi:hypothetical protein